MNSRILNFIRFSLKDEMLDDLPLLASIGIESKSRSRALLVSQLVEALDIACILLQDDGFIVDHIREKEGIFFMSVEESE